MCANDPVLFSNDVTHDDSYLHPAAASIERASEVVSITSVTLDTSVFCRCVLHIIINLFDKNMARLDQKDLYYWHFVWQCPKVCHLDSFWSWLSTLAGQVELEELQTNCEPLLPDANNLHFVED